MYSRKFGITIAFAATLGLAACSGTAENAQMEAEDAAEEVYESASGEDYAYAEGASEADANGDAMEADADSEAGDAGTGDALETPAPSAGLIGDAVVWCSDVRKRVTPAVCQSYRDQIADLDQGIAAFDPPRDMVKGQSREVRLAIGPEEEKERIESLAGDQGQAATAGIEIGAKMRARLTGRAFDIDPALPVDLEMGRSRRQVWTWDVTPRREGTHPLSAEITVLATDGTILNRYPSDLIRVNVTVSPSEAAEIARKERARKRQETEEKVGFLTKMAKLLLEFWWAVVALIGGIIGGFFYLRSKLRNKEATPPPS